MHILSKHKYKKRGANECWVDALVLFAIVTNRVSKRFADTAKCDAALIPLSLCALLNYTRWLINQQSLQFHLMHTQ